MESIELNPIQLLTKDLKNSSRTLLDHEARFLVDNYYTMQDNRIRASAQVREMNKSEEPNLVLDWLEQQNRSLENQIKCALEKYAKSKPIGEWMLSICGIGPVITAGLLAHIDIKKCPSACNIFSYAGYNPYQGYYEVNYMNTGDLPKIFPRTSFYMRKNENNTFSGWFVNVNNEIELKQISAEEIDHVKLPEPGTTITDQKLIDLIISIFGRLIPKRWEKGSKRPFNATLKTLFWKIGESFIKHSSKPSDCYGKYYHMRKEQEIAYNAMGRFADISKKKLVDNKIGKTTDAYKSYIEGKLPPAHIHARARRYAVKLFISHMHAVWFQYEFGVAPARPFVLTLSGHEHMIEIPNNPF